METRLLHNVEHANKRSAYQHALTDLVKLQKVAPAKAAKLATFFKAEFNRRPAFLDELKKVGM